ncbi:MAG: tRNA (N(6)-L-threonylcarbamoyladenosine(37)-C(2))-methylthiotransferase MtaB [Vicinamibacterales bacterium]
MKYSVVTFGCRVNQADSLVIEETLRSRGGQAVSPADADLVIVNSCSVTATADQGTRQTIRRIARQNPAARVVVTGCYATRRSHEVAALPGVIRVVTNGEKDAWSAILDECPPVDPARFGDGEGPCGSSLQPGVAGRTALTLRVQTGCSEPCSYCIIPTTRGRGRSKPFSTVVRDIDRALDAGYREIAITGVHLGSYGRDLGNGDSLTSLVEHLASRREDVLFRISSLEPMDCTPEIVAAVAGSRRLAPHFHLPLQHGSDEVLRAMRRPYTAATFERLVHSIHDVLPWAAIGSDLIVGFPGESEQDALATERVVSGLPLSHLHVFPYSDRPGTTASRLSGKIDGMAVRARGQRLRAIGARLSRCFRQSQEGSCRRALVVDDGRSAVTDNYLKVPLPEPHPRNTWVEVTIPPATGDGQPATSF